MICCWCADANVTESASIDIAAPADSVWEVLIDLENAANVVSHLISVERITKGDKKFEVGTRWTETRMFRGKRVTQEKTVVGITDNPRSVTVDISTKTPGPLFWSDKETAERGTVTILSNDDDRNCSTLLWTFAFSSSSFLSSIYIHLCKPCLLRYAHQYCMVELEDIAAAAEKRAQASS